MSEARELFEALADQLKKLAHLHVTKGTRDVAAALSNTRNAIAEALATRPEPVAVPELPEYVREFGDGWRVPIARGRWFGLPTDCAPDDLDRIAEACTKLAARERARRAGP